MRSYRITQFGRADGIVCAADTMPDCGPNEVLVRIRATSLNYRDIMILNGAYPIAAAIGTIPISDGAGEVVAIGSNVTRFVPGDRVASLYFCRWLGGRLTLELSRHQFGASLDGFLATYRAIHEDCLVQMADHLSFEEAATYPCAGVTAWSAVSSGRRVLPGEHVLVVGGGGVAQFAMQFARLAGAHVIAVTTNPDKAALFHRLGAHDVIVASRSEDWSCRVLSLTAKRGVDHVVEAVGPATLSRSITCCGVDAEIALCGAFADDQTAQFDLKVLSGRLITIRRLAVGSREASEDMMRSVAYHQMRPAISRVFAFEDAQLAYNHILGGHHAGKVVISGDMSPD